MDPRRPPPEAQIPESSLKALAEACPLANSLTITPFRGSRLSSCRQQRKRSRRSPTGSRSPAEPHTTSAGNAFSIGVCSCAGSIARCVSALRRPGFLKKGFCDPEYSWIQATIETSFLGLKARIRRLAIWWCPQR
jgi:hypothetical protein